jgi:uncharacterized protein (TIGR00661 family)
MKRVLITPLDWGLGHATRCIPVIREFLRRECEVSVAGNGDSLLLLKAEFPALRFFNIPGYSPRYPNKGGFMIWKMIVQLPEFLKAIREEHVAIEKLVKEQRIDLLISDNRYGCWSPSVFSIFITHQSNILMPKRFGWLAGLVRRKNESYMKHFGQCWLPDYPGDHSLAGELLSFGKIARDIPHQHIGSLSRFRRTSDNAKKKYDVVAVFSGPEPQRTILENRVLPQLQRSGYSYFVVRGVLGKSPPVSDPNCINFLTTEALQQLLESAALVIGRSGYSTVMDMAALGKKAVFVPTPGQTEQEYLAQRLREKKIAFFMKQDDFDLQKAFSEVDRFSGFSSYFSSGSDLLGKAIDEVLQDDRIRATSGH